MTWSLGATLALALLALGCAVDGEPWAEADQAIWGVPQITNLTPKAGTVGYADPAHLLDSAEGWGPQTLLLSVNRAVQPQVTVMGTPSVQMSKEKITRTLQSSLGFSLSEAVELDATSSTNIIEGWYERLEAYPTFQAITWDLVLDGLSGARKIGSGTVYRPAGIFFRTVVLVRGPGHQGISPAPEPPPTLSNPVLAEEASAHH